VTPRHVVERCPSCGVEHEAPGDGTCEACGTVLRHWCRAHGPETGWLDAPACSRCAEEAARPPVPQPAPRPPVTRPAATRPRSAVAAAGRLVRRPVRAPVKAEKLPPSLMARVGGGFLSVLLVSLGGWLLGVVGGVIYVIMIDPGNILTVTAGAWGRAGAWIGLFMGVINALVYIGQSPASPKE
jgi:hypothetical protein